MGHTNHRHTNLIILRVWNVEIAEVIQEYLTVAFLYVLSIYRDYNMVTFISSPISSRGRAWTPRVDTLSLCILIKCRNFQDLFSFSFLFVKSPKMMGDTKLLRTLLDVLKFTIFFLFLGPYFHIFVHFPCYFHARLVQIMSKSPWKASDVFDVRHLDFVTSTLSMTFQGTWALILALIRASARQLKCSPNRQFAWFSNRKSGIL